MVPELNPAVLGSAAEADVPYEVIAGGVEAWRVVARKPGGTTASCRQAAIEHAYRAGLAAGAAAEREQIADTFRTVEMPGSLGWHRDDMVRIVLTGMPDPRLCKCGHLPRQHNDRRSGWTERTMQTDPNCGNCQECSCFRYDRAATGDAETNEADRG
jgi:hypothetical protein